MSSIRKAVLFCAGLVAGAALMFVSQSMMALEPGSTVESFTAFLQRIQSDQVKEVTYTGGTGIAYVTSDGKRFVTTAPPAPVAFEGLTNRIIDRGVVVRATGSD